MLLALATRGGTLVLYAHDIARRSAANHIDPERLAGILAEARRLGLQLVGFDELPRCASAAVD